MFSDNYNIDINDGDPCARPGCPGRATWTSGHTGKRSPFCSTLCYQISREWQRNHDWESRSVESGNTYAMGFIREQQEILEQIDALVSKYRQSRRPAEHGAYVRRLARADAEAHAAQVEQAEAEEKSHVL